MYKQFKEQILSVCNEFVIDEAAEDDGGDPRVIEMVGKIQRLFKDKAVLPYTPCHRETEELFDD